MPTLFGWGHSALIYDIKKELWNLTAGYRRKFSYCWRFEPTSADSVRFNPHFEIRRGDNDVQDAQVIVLRRREGQHGPFWSSTRYPECRHTAAEGESRHR